MKYTTLLLTAILLVNFACKEAKNEPVPFSEMAGNIPLLKSGKHLGLIVGFNSSHPPATTDSIEARWQEAIQAGMTAGRLQIDWPELEPEPGEYEKEVLEDALQNLEDQGLNIFLTISAYDSDGPVVPEDLEDLSFDDSRISTRFAQLMDWVIPMLIEHGGWAIAISNEPDNFFADEPQLADNIFTFLENSRSHIHQVDERMAVSITMNAGNLSHSREAMLKLRSITDVSAFNIYGAGLSGNPFTPLEIQEEINNVLDFAGDKNIIFQEVGMYSDQPTLNSSEEIQRTFFEIFFQTMENEPQMRAAYVFQMVDWSPETIELFNTLYEPGTPQSFIDQYSAVLGSLGLIHYETGERKAAWDEFIQWIERF